MLSNFVMFITASLENQYSFLLLFFSFFNLIHIFERLSQDFFCFCFCGGIGVWTVVLEPHLQPLLLLFFWKRTQSEAIPRSCFLYVVIQEKRKSSSLPKSSYIFLFCPSSFLIKEPPLSLEVCLLTGNSSGHQKWKEGQVLKNNILGRLK